MSLLINGELKDDWEIASNKDGEYVRKDSQFRHTISPQPETGNPFHAESGRYHLYVSYACPWAHRTLIFRELKQLQDHISVSVVSPDMGTEGWHFSPFPDSTIDHLYNSSFMYELYVKSQADYTGIVTVPVLWDKHTQTIVNNESSEIIRILNTAFNEITGNTDDYYPEELRTDIDDVNKLVYDNVNNGVYRAGFASTQEAYDKAFTRLFDALEQLEQRLGEKRYLTGNRITEADWRLFTTLLRFDPVYVGHFKCNLKRIADFPNLSNYMRELYQVPGISKTFNLAHVKRHYYWSHKSINPKGIVPQGPALDYDKAHNRDKING